MATRKLLVNKSISRKLMAEIAWGEYVQEVRQKRFKKLMQPYLKHGAVKEMENYIQHGFTTTKQHCENVAWTCYAMNEKFKLGANDKSLVKVGMLHDLYLYDWHEKGIRNALHGYTHAKTASEKADYYFYLNDKEKAAIRSHMWPLNITKIPSSREAVILCLADKYCSTMETIYRNTRVKMVK